MGAASLRPPCYRGHLVLLLCGRLSHLPAPQEAVEGPFEMDEPGLVVGGLLALQEPVRLARQQLRARPGVGHVGWALLDPVVALDGAGEGVQLADGQAVLVPGVDAVAMFEGVEGARAHRAYRGVKCSRSSPLARSRWRRMPPTSWAKFEKSASSSSCSRRGWRACAAVRSSTQSMMLPALRPLTSASRSRARSAILRRMTRSSAGTASISS